MLNCDHAMYETQEVFIGPRLNSYNFLLFEFFRLYYNSYPPCFLQFLGKSVFLFFFFFNDPATPEIYPLPLPAALPIYRPPMRVHCRSAAKPSRSSSCPADSSRSPTWIRRRISSTASRTRWSGSSSASSWDRWASRTVLPLTIVPSACSPLVRATLPPSRTFSSEVLPLPLTPTIPTRSPGPRRQVTWSSTARSPAP